MTLAARAIGLVLVYLGVVLAPLVFASIGASQPDHDFATNFSVALGFTGLAMMGLEFALVARIKTFASAFGQDGLLQFHRQIGYVGLAFVLAHFALSAKWGELTVRNALHAPLLVWFGMAAMFALVLLVASSAWRRRLRLSYEAWHVAHALLATVLIVGAVGHIYFVDEYVDSLWKQILWGVMSAAFVGLLVWVRLVKPSRAAARPWRVASVRAERGDTTVVGLAPPDGVDFRFQPGQFAWFAFDRSSIGQDEGPGFALIAGGVGIAGLISMLRTMADRGDVRPVLLFYGNREWDEIAFRDELDGLRDRLDLTLVHVLERPPAGWEGETGYVTADLLRRHLPPAHRRFQYFICGPDPMMDAAEAALADLGVPADRVHTERFNMA